MAVPGSNGLCVHDYVPLYFAQRTPILLAVINQKNVDQRRVVYLALPIVKYENRADVYFTDASANTIDPPNFYPMTDAAQLGRLNWGVIGSNAWAYRSDEARHQKMAELLVPQKIEVQDFGRIIAWDASAMAEVRQIFVRKGIEPPVIEASSFHYYYDPASNWSQSIITGPIELAQLVEKTIQNAIALRSTQPRFASLADAVQGIRRNFGCVKELADIDGLQAGHGPHNDDVGTHSRRVANGVRQSNEYAQLSTDNQLILELAAYLHDIGKGPKSRWPMSKMSGPDNDHARKSLPMLERILANEIGGLSDDQIRKIVVLVTYDDLLGEIVAKGRSKCQLFRILQSTEDVDMLVALSKSDIGSLDNGWLDDVSEGIAELRREAINQL